MAALQKVFSQSNVSFGQKNKPRTEDPTMFDLLKWNTVQDDKWDFKKDRISPQKENEAKKYPLRINHEKNNWVTEQKDNYRKINKIGDDYVQEISKERLKEIQEDCQDHQPLLKQSNQQTLSKKYPPADYRNHPEYNPKYQSLYRDNYSTKNIQDYNQLMEQLELNNRSFKGKARPSQNYQDYQDQIQQQDEDQTQKYQDGQEILVEEDEEEELEDAIAFSKKVKPQAKKLDLSNPEDVAKLKRRQERLKKFNNTTRWLPNTAFTTYFGKPSWGPYGYGNVQPSNGGIIYGQHMLSHNVQPHRQSNNPRYPQSYNNAIRFSQNVAEIEPEPPRKCKEEDRINQNQVQVLMNRNPLTPQPFEEVKKTITTSKGKQHAPNQLKIKKPDLQQSLRFASEKGSVDEEYAKQIELQKEKLEKKKKEQSKKSEKSTQKIDGKQSEPQSGGQEQRKQPLSDEKRQKKTQQTDQLAIPDKSGRKFIDEMKQRKEQRQRLTPKVNEVNPKLLSDSISAPNLLKHNINPQDQQELQSVNAILIRNPPVNYLSQLDPTELNPKYYKNIPSEWMQRIPYAGKQKEKSLNARECFDFGY